MLAKTTCIAGLAQLLIAVSAAHAQEPTMLGDTLKQELRQLMTQQEIYYSRHTTYTGDVSQLKGLAKNVTFTIQSTDLVHGYVAEIVHPALKGASCVVRIGKTGKNEVRTRGGKLVAEGGIITCDPMVQSRQ